MRTARHLALAIAWVCTLLASGLVLLHVLPEAQAATTWLAMAASFIPYGIVLWLVAVLLFVAGGQRWTKLLAFPALVALVIQVGWARPYWPGSPTQDPPPNHVRVLAANVHYGKADPASLARVVAEVDPDVIVVIEASDPFLDSDAMTGAMLERPHRVGRAVPGFAKVGREDASGTVVLSRFPLTEAARVPSRFDQYVVSVDSGEIPLTLVAAHPMNMVTGAHIWEREGLVLRDAVRPHLAEPLAVIGDLNATPEQLTLRGLLDEGLVLGAQDAGAGWQPTFNNGLALPPLIPIDHVLTNDRVRTLTFRTFPIDRSDHWAIAADLAYG